MSPEFVLTIVWATYMLGSLIGQFPEGIWTNTNPDTYIHADLLILGTVSLVGVWSKRWRDRKGRLKR